MLKYKYLEGIFYLDDYIYGIFEKNNFKKILKIKEDLICEKENLKIKNKLYISSKNYKR